MSGRPKGSKNKPDALKTGPKIGATKVHERMTHEEIVALKEKIVKLLDDREVDNLSQAAKALDISPMKLYAWRGNDAAWKAQLDQVNELIADELEEKLKTVTTVPQCTAMIFKLKKLRPEYRDSFKLTVGSAKMEALLEELRKLGNEPKDGK